MQQLIKDYILIILERTWEATETKPRLLKKDIKQFTKTDWEFSAIEIEELLKKYGLKITGESIAGLLEKQISSRNIAIYILAVFILFKEKRLDASELQKLESFKTSKHYFLNKLLDTIKFETIEQTNQSEELLFINNNIDNRPTQLWVAIFSILIILFIGISISFYVRYHKQQPKENNEIKLSYSFPKGKEIPITVAFNYDISSYSYDSAFFDYGDGKKIRLNTNKGIFKHTYTAPRELSTVIYVDTIKKTFPLIIPSNGWFTIAGSNGKFHYYKKNEAKQNGYLHLSLDKVPAYVLDPEGHYLTSHINIADFDYDCDNLVFETLVKNPIDEGGIRCFDIGIDLVGFFQAKKEVISFNILEPTCTAYSRIKIAKTEIGYNSPIPYPKPILKGFDTSGWLKIRFITHKNVLNIYANNEVIYSLPYHGRVGKLKFIQISFLGTGSIEWVKIKNNEGKLLMYDDFE